MPTFEHAFTVRAPLAAVAEFHHDPRALRRLTPPPVFVQLHRAGPLAEGALSEFTLWFGPFPVRWKALHTRVDPLHGFIDTQVAGPMQCWEHTHTFTAEPGGTRVRDRIRFEHHAGWRGAWTRVLFTPAALCLLFLYREHITRRAVDSRPGSRAGRPSP